MTFTDTERLDAMESGCGVACDEQLMGGVWLRVWYCFHSMGAVERGDSLREVLDKAILAKQTQIN